MPETWIHPNRRALALGFVLPAALLAAALGAEHAAQSWDGNVLLRTVAIVFTLLAFVSAGTLWRMLRQPRIAYEPGSLLFYFGSSSPERIPIENVECFFIGQAGGMIPDAKGGEAEVQTVIVRLAESATEYHHREIKAALGHWCEGYVTIRGTWCEAITPQLMQHLNRRLVEVQREQKAQAEARA